MLAKIFFTGKYGYVKTIFPGWYGTIVFPANIGTVGVIRLIKINNYFIVKDVIKDQVNIPARCIALFAGSKVCKGKKQLVLIFGYSHQLLRLVDIQRKRCVVQ